MLKEYSSSASWNSAAIAGLAMAAVTVAAELAGGLCSKVTGIAGGLLNFLAWAGKLVLCAWMFHHLMKRFHEGYEGVDYFALKRYGFKLALFSSLLVAAYSLVNFLVINPDTISELMDGYLEAYASKIDSNTQAALDRMIPKLPAYSCAVMVVYCYLWGWIYSGIFSRKIAPYDPFSDFKDTPDNQ